MHSRTVHGPALLLPYNVCPVRRMCPGATGTKPILKTSMVVQSKPASLPYAFLVSFFKALHNGGSEWTSTLAGRQRSAPLGWPGVWRVKLLTRKTQMPLPPANLTSITDSPEAPHLQEHKANCQGSINNARDQEKLSYNKASQEQGHWRDIATIQIAVLRQSKWRGGFCKPLLTSVSTPIN